jgi:hypothetical protein
MNKVLHFRFRDVGAHRWLLWEDDSGDWTVWYNINQLVYRALHE